MPAPTEASLLAAIYADPANDEPRAMYADFLVEKGKPLGEFIALGLARAQGKRGTKAREEALLAQHGHGFWPGHPGALDAVPSLAAIDRGFPSRAFNVFGGDTEKRGAKLAGAPAWATIRRLLTVGEWKIPVYRKILASPMPILEVIEGITPKMLAACGDDLARFPSLRELLVDARDFSEAALPPSVRARLVGKAAKADGNQIRLRLKAAPVMGKRAKGAKPVKASKASPKPPPSAFWEELIQAEPDSDAERHLSLTADKTVGKLPRELPAALVQRIYVYYIDERPYVLWPALARVDDEHVEPLLRAIKKSEPSFEGQLVVAAHRAGAADGIRAAGVLFDFIRKSTNLKGLYKRMPQLAAPKALVDGIEDAVVRFDTDDEYGVPILPFYASVYLLERERPRSKAFPLLDKKCRKWESSDTLERAREAARG